MFYANLYDIAVIQNKSRRRQKNDFLDSVFQQKEPSKMHFV